MKFKHTFLLAVFGISQSTVMLAAQSAGPVDASIALGYVGTSGNTDTSSFNTEFLVTLRSQQWTHNGKLQAMGSQQDSTTKAERYYLEDKSDYNLDASQYLFGKGSYLDDRFSGYSYQASAAAGYGRFLINEDKLKLQAFGGVGYRQTALKNLSGNGDAIVTLGEKLEWSLSGSAKLVQSLSSDIGSNLTMTVFEVGLVSQIIDRIASKIAIQASNISEVPAGKKKTDTQTSISLSYSF